MLVGDSPGPDLQNKMLAPGPANIHSPQTQGLDHHGVAGEATPPLGAAELLFLPLLLPRITASDAQVAHKGGGDRTAAATITAKAGHRILCQTVNLMEARRTPPGVAQEHLSAAGGDVHSNEQWGATEEREAHVHM